MIIHSLSYGSRFFGICDNRSLLDEAERVRGVPTRDVVIELVESYGMPVGADVFQTCIWIGRFDPDETATLIGRGQVKMHLCHTMKAKDSNIRQALIDRYGPGKDKAVGKKASPGPLYGLKSHLWAALALGVTYYDQTKGGNS